jgi:flavin-binding protein dodecin
MFAEITIVAAYDRKTFSGKLIKLVGTNRSSVEQALQGTIFADSQATITSRIVAAEIIREAVSVLYFFEGNDTVAVHVTAQTVAQLKAQSVRITRQLRSQFEQPSKLSATVAIVTQEQSAFYAPIIKGEYISRVRRITSRLTENWLSKIVAPAVVYFLTALMLGGTPAAVSGGIALVAAVASFLIEAISSAFVEDDWKWSVSR